jgi:hypothetical protein
LLTLLLPGHAGQVNYLPQQVKELLPFVVVHRSVRLCNALAIFWPNALQLPFPSP